MITANFKGLEYTGKNLIEVIWELSKEFNLLFIGITDPEYLDFCYKPHEFDVKEWDYNLFKVKYVILEDTGEESFAHEQGFVSWDKVYAETKRLEEEIPTSSFTSYSVKVED